MLLRVYLELMFQNLNVSDKLAKNLLTFRLAKIASILYLKNKN